MLTVLKNFGETLTKEEVQKIIQEGDEDDIGAIKESTFLKLVEIKMSEDQTTRELNEVFKIFSNGAETITAANIQNFM